MRTVITGAHGFLGWHVSCRLRSTRGIEPVRLTRVAFGDGSLRQAVREADVIIHLAGVNRSTSENAVEAGNVWLAQELADSIRWTAGPVHVVYANSVQSLSDGAYGRGKAEAARLIADAVGEVGGGMTNVLLPNLFGEHGRPHYNSFVATFCHEIVSGRSPRIDSDREIPLLHAQEAAEVLIAAAEEETSGTLQPTGENYGIAEVAQRLTEYKALYDRGEIPDLADRFSVDLFNTYRSHAFPRSFPQASVVHADDRGRLFEAMRSHGGTGQTFVSITAPGATRGDHYHLHKVERFFVVKGEAEISLRRLLHDDVVRFRLSGRQPSFVDMPTMWVHNICNVGDDELVTVFWADQLLDPDEPDQYPERVEPAVEDRA